MQVSRVSICYFSRLHSMVGCCIVSYDAAMCLN